MEKKFAVINSKRNVSKYKSILEKHDLEIKEINNMEDEQETCEIFYITIKSLEELLSIKEELGMNIILADEFIDAFTNIHNEPAIEIYDDYRE